MELTSGRDGHFHVDARVDGWHIDFMVDTGASLVVVRETDASNIGVHPMPRD
jgi:aspartyl protease family protein